MTIEVPTPSAELLAQLETANAEVLDSEKVAVAAIRERFAAYAKHNGFIKIGEESARRLSQDVLFSALYSDIAGGLPR